MNKKKRVRSVNISQDMFRLWGRRLVRELQHIPVFVFIKYGRWVNMGVGIVVLAAAGIIFAQVLYFDPSGVVDVPRTEQKLQVQIIDHLEFWLEEREAERRKELNVPRANVLLPSDTVTN